MPIDPAAERSPMRGISRNVFVLGLVSLFTDASTEMLYPLIPLFLTQTLGAPVAVLGLIEGVAEAVASLLKGVSGWVSDRIGRRRPLVIFGYGLAAVTKPLMALAVGWPLVLVARVLDRFGKGVRGAPRDALIADSTETASRGRAFGFHRSADQTGAVVGPLLAVPLLALFHGDLRALFLVAFIPAAIGVAALLAVRETGQGSRAAGTRTTVRGATPAFRHFLWIMLLFSVGNSSDMFLIMRAKEAGFSARDIVLLFAAFNLVYVLAAYPAGVIADRIGARRVISGGLGIFAVVYLGFGLTGGPLWICGLFLVYGLYQGLTDGSIRAYAAGLVPETQRATALGTLAMGMGLAAFIASAAGGLLWQRFGAPATFLYGATTAAVSAVLLGLTRPKEAQLC